MRPSRRLWLCPLTALALMGMGLLGLWFAIPLELERITRVDGSPALYDADGQLFHLRLSPDSEWQLPIPLSEMGRWLPLVAVGVEDGRFYRHHGVDFFALARAAAQNLTSGRVVSGASTITSQLVRLAVSERELGPDGLTRSPRNLPTKIREFILALKLERVFSKEDILEGYLNRAPFGGTIRGVQAASLLYFGKPASKVSPGEACLLIGMLRGPSLYRPDIRPEAARARRDAIIRLMVRKGLFTPEEGRRAQLEELPRRASPPPRRAWHFAELALENTPQGTENLRTTLRLDLQTHLESILRQAARGLPAHITLAAGIVENRGARLAAWVGNARFEEGGFPQAGANWVDCGRAPRSPGSTLKPFVYLSAMEQGLLTPGVMLADSPLAFSGRAPRNFDLRYRGAVSARVALSESLNAPAVRVLRLAGPERVLRLMREAGLEHLNRPASHYGDSLALGGCEATLLEELGAFTALANLGEYRPLSVLEGETPPARRIASKAASWMICDVLNHRGPLSLFARGTLGQRWQTALKTGTSYGLRDAWTLTWTPDFTVGVWVGAPDGSSWPGLVGAQAAAPVAIRILRAVSPLSSWYERPEGLIQRPVCSLSGLPPTAACPSRALDWAIGGVSRTVPCGLHTLKEGRAALLWPAELAALGRPGLQRRAPLTIVSPVAGAVYFLAPFDAQRKIPLRSEGAQGQVWWYLDGRYAGTSSAQETFFCPIPDALGGDHVVGVMDALGRSAEAAVKVLTPGRAPAAPALE